MAEPVLYQWPLVAKFGRVVPKTKFYEHGNVRTALLKKFVDDIQRITWAYKLADDTIRLRGTAAVPEIQVFTVETKGADVSDDVLTAIDKTVHFPIIFEVTGDDRVRTVAAQKTLGGDLEDVGVCTVCVDGGEHIVGDIRALRLDGEHLDLLPRCTAQAGWVSSASSVGPGDALDVVDELLRARRCGCCHARRSSSSARADRTVQSGASGTAWMPGNVRHRRAAPTMARKAISSKSSSPARWSARARCGGRG